MDLSHPEGSSVNDGSDFTLTYARSVGFGAFLNGRWFTGRWLPPQQSASIAFKELFPIVLATHVWGSSWRGLRVQFFCDNKGVSEVISRRFCLDAALGGALAQPLPGSSSPLLLGVRNPRARSF